MNDFDPVRASFWLVALVIGAHVAMVFLATMTCIAFSSAIIAGNATCSADGKLSEILAAALSAALAFSGTLKRK